MSLVSAGREGDAKTVLDVGSTLQGKIAGI